MSIISNLEKLKNEIPSQVKLVAVSKTRTKEEILEAYNCGYKAMGENKAQELANKYPNLPTDIDWHFVGHLQTNKIRLIAPFVKMLHSIDSIHILVEVNKEAARINKKIDCLLQFYIADEDTKFGLSLEEAHHLLSSPSYPTLHNINVCGVMGMATYTEDKNQIRKEFKMLKSFYDNLKNSFFKSDTKFKEISMGMSNDYKIAIEEGATIVRIGTEIFGERIYLSPFSKR